MYYSESDDELLGISDAFAHFWESFKLNPPYRVEEAEVVYLYNEDGSLWGMMSHGAWRCLKERAAGIGKKI